MELREKSSRKPSGYNSKSRTRNKENRNKTKEKIYFIQKSRMKKSGQVTKMKKKKPN